MANSNSDLHFTVTFSDGSTWEDRFRRLDRWSERKQEYVASSKFLNDFMSGEDEMNGIEIREALNNWLVKTNPGIEFTIKWKYA